MKNVQKFHKKLGFPHQEVLFHPFPRVNVRFISDLEQGNENKTIDFFPGD